MEFVIIINRCTLYQKSVSVFGCRPPDSHRAATKNATRAESVDKLPEDIFDIQYINAMAKERIGYPTQKPEALLERIIKASSNEGDLILDPFMGGGTTIAVAEKLMRRWIGIDQSVAAVKVTELRLDKQQDLYSPPFSVQLHKYDYETLRNKDAFEFESWILQQYGGEPNVQQRGDSGTYIVAVKVVDNEGLESVETIKLKVNGVVETL
ncbi:MAG: site-specific DNA-methyltransferase [Planctomycetaceae bacterium]|jgi:hypothetical protein|nr:site-specific DNA-methyltransferase [Planctomycetaceae bacterium]